MAKAKKKARDPEPFPDAEPLPKQEKMRELYYSGSQMMSPVGGFLEPVGVHYGEAGPGMVLFECLASSLRFKLKIPKAKRSERRKVREIMSDGMDGYCPRHGHLERLVRVGKHLVCNKCGVRFAQAT